MKWSGTKRIKLVPNLSISSIFILTNFALLTPCFAATLLINLLLILPSIRFLSMVASLRPSLIIFTSSSLISSANVFLETFPPPHCSSTILSECTPQLTAETAPIAISAVIPLVFFTSFPKSISTIDCGTEGSSRSILYIGELAMALASSKAFSTKSPTSACPGMPCISKFFLRSVKISNVCKESFWDFSEASNSSILGLPLSPFLAVSFNHS